MPEGIVEIIDRLNEITRLQAEAISDLFALLAEHMAADELDNLPAVSKINEAATIKKELQL